MIGWLIDLYMRYDMYDERKEKREIFENLGGFFWGGREGGKEGRRGERERERGRGREGNFIMI